ncbi:MAG: hypothetical protein LBK22_06905 [Tannerella sp.]|jgi:ribosomal protein L7Ae-like RNA K-turn-binding protein|nr:hypothetical protein [Tannerella sp.]
MRIKNLFVAAAIAALFPACSQILPPAIQSPKAIEELVADLKKISKDYQIEKVVVHEKEELSGSFGMAVADLRNSNGEAYEQTLYYNFGIPHNDPKPQGRRQSGRENPHYINVEDIAARKDLIEKYVEEAKTQIPEGYTFESADFMVFSTDDRGEFALSFDLQVTETGKAARMEGGRHVTDYYTLKFSVDKDGNITHDEW